MLGRAATGDEDRLAAMAALRIARARSAAGLEIDAWRSMMRTASAGSASIMWVMWNGGPSVALGAGVEAHGSGGPGSAAAGSYVKAVMDPEDRSSADVRGAGSVGCDPAWGRREPPDAIPRRIAEPHPADEGSTGTGP